MPNAVILAFCVGGMIGGVAGAAASSLLRRQRQRSMARQVLRALDQGRLGDREPDSQAEPFGSN